jgi:hypothetical protein
VPALSRDTVRLLLLTAIMLLSGVILMSVGFAMLNHSRVQAAAKMAAERAARSQVATPAPKAAPRALVPSSPPTPSVITSTPPVAVRPTPAPAPVTPAGPSVDAYRGLGSWVDIYDSAWNDPPAVVADMASHGVRTLYIETGNSRSSGDLFKQAKLEQFITEAHARKMKVVAWYLPDMKDLTKDYTRIEKAIDLTTSGGQKFDSFALDIESSAISSPSARNAALATLSQKIRDKVGPTYPLGAIIPSPVGLAKGNSWPSFPYTNLARLYDAFVPMSYYTYHGNGAAAAYADTIGNVRILRQQKGCSTVPIHLIGGVAEDSTAAELGEFVRGSQESGCIGASLYSWPGTTAADWQKLKGVAVR